MGQVWGVRGDRESGGEMGREGSETWGKETP